MEGPFDKLYGNTVFDLNHDGKIDAAETAFLYDTILSDVISDSNKSAFDEDEADEFGDDF